jgi:hypothetical protein
MSNRGSITLAELVGKLDLLEIKCTDATDMGASAWRGLSKITALIRGCLIYGKASRAIVQTRAQLR